MSNFYAYDGTTWRDASEVWAYDGATWRDIQEAWAYDGAVWRQVFGGGCSGPSCDSFTENWSEASCASGRCKYCMTLEHTGCDDACNNIDGFVSTNGGSFLASASCSNKTCQNKSATDCSATDFDCDITSKCPLNTTTIQGQLKMQRSIDSVYTCTRTGASMTGSCLS